MILNCGIQGTVSLGGLKLEAKSELVAEITVTKYKKTDIVDTSSKAVASNLSFPIDF
jgi:hypothetical protein